MTDPETSHPDGPAFAVAEAGGENPPRGTVMLGLVKVLVGVILGVAAVDVVSGILRPAGGDAAGGDSKRMTLDPELGWRSTPGFADELYQINGLGLRDPEIPEDAPKDEVRVVGTGASNTYGLGVTNEDTWSYALQARMPRGVRVLNGGVEGYSILQAVRRAGRLMDMLEPDLVTVTVFPGRQGLFDSSPAKRWTRVGDMVVPRTIVEDWPESLRWIPARTHKVLLHSNLYRSARALDTRLEGGAPPELTEYVLTGAEIPEAFVSPLAEARQEVQALGEYARERGIELRFVVINDNRFCRDDRWREYLEQHQAAGAPSVDTPKEEPFDALAAWLESAGVEVWDLRETLFELASDWETNVLPNVHWSPSGHAMIAEELDRRLRASGLLDTLVARRKAAPRTFHRARPGLAAPETSGPAAPR